jgi:hypothetical protein
MTGGQEEAKEKVRREMRGKDVRAFYASGFSSHCGIMSF